MGFMVHPDKRKGYWAWGYIQPYGTPLEWGSRLSYHLPGKERNLLPGTGWGPRDKAFGGGV